jgi:hypothetical protein
LVLVAFVDSVFGGAGAGAGAGAGFAAGAADFSSTELHANAKTAANEIAVGQDTYLTKLFISLPPRLLLASIEIDLGLHQKLNFFSLKHTSICVVKATVAILALRMRWKTLRNIYR